MRTNLLAQHGNGIVRQADGVEGVDTVPGLYGGVGGAPLEAHAPLDVGEHLDGGDALDAVLEQVLRPRVRHEACRGAGVGPAPDEVQLAAAALLGRGAKETDAGCRCVARPGGVEGGDEAQEAGEGGGRDEVVPTGVADARQRVVLGVEDDEASVVTAGRDEVGGKGRVEAIGARRDGDAEGGKGRGGEQAGEGLVGVVLVVGELWVGVDLGVGRQSTRPSSEGA